MNLRAALASVLVVFATSSALAQAPVPAPAKPLEPQFGQKGKDVVWVPMPFEAVERLLDIAKVTPQDFVIDLGSGDGRTVLAAARRGAQALGVEFDAGLVEYSRRLAREQNLAGRARFEQGDLFQADLSKASVITLFLLQPMNLKLRPSLLKLAPGTRIIANTFHMAEWKPDHSEYYPSNCEAWCNLYLWIVPANIEGEWKAPQGTLKVRQTFQEIDGTLGGGPSAVRITGRLDGDRVRFTAAGSQYTARVNGNIIEGTVNTGSGIRPWRAER
jgi:hypothetical protein